jgi:magnesium chelatase family protein
MLALINHFKGTQILAHPQPRIAEDTINHLDLRDIKGQETVKRALEVAAAGGHNLLL